jgi:hypothetical protein
MAEERTINTKTELTVLGNGVKIFTYYLPNELPNTLEAFIAEILSSLEGVGYQEGDLVLVLKNYPGQINFFLNADGTMNVEADDAAQYSINENGELIYNKI